MTESAVQPHSRPRLRGVILIVVAIVLLLAGLLLMGSVRPTAGEAYGAGARWMIALLLLAGWLGLLWGIFRVVVGSGTGPLATLLKVVASVVIVAGMALGALGALVVREGMKNAPRSAAHDNWSFDDWFDD